MTRYLVAARENVEMWAFPNGTYAVRIGDKARMFDEGSCAQDNWYDAYSFFHQVNDKQNKKGRAA